MRPSPTRPQAPAPPRPDASAEKQPSSQGAKALASRQADVDQVVALPIRHRHAAGVDIGSRSHWVCTGFSDETDETDLVCEFPAHTDGLHAPVAHLKGQQVTTVAMESTSFYWVPLYELLE